MTPEQMCEIINAIPDNSKTLENIEILLNEIRDLLQKIAEK